MSEPVEIARFIDIRQAEFVQSVLEGSGIEAFLDQQFTGNIAPHYMLYGSGIRLFVAVEDEERAREVLADFEDAPLAPEE